MRTLLYALVIILILLSVACVVGYANGREGLLASGANGTINASSDFAALPMANVPNSAVAFAVKIQGDKAAWTALFDTARAMRDSSGTNYDLICNTNGGFPPPTTGSPYSAATATDQNGKTISGTTSPASYVLAGRQFRGNIFAADLGPNPPRLVVTPNSHVWVKFAGQTSYIDKTNEVVYVTQQRGVITKYPHLNARPTQASLSGGGPVLLSLFASTHSFNPIDRPVAALSILNTGAVGMTIEIGDLEAWGLGNTYECYQNTQGQTLGHKSSSGACSPIIRLYISVHNRGGTPMLIAIPAVNNISRGKKMPLIGSAALNALTVRFFAPSIQGGAWVSASGMQASAQTQSASNNAPLSALECRLLKNLANCTITTGANCSNIHKCP